VPLISSESYSTRCDCGSLSAGIFLVSKNIRTEASRLYWSNNTFFYHGPVGPDHFGYADDANFVQVDYVRVLKEVPKSCSKTMRRLLIDILSNLHGSLSYPALEGAWKSALMFLGRNAGPNLQVKFWTSSKTSVAWGMIIMSPSMTGLRVQVIETTQGVCTTDSTV
jgi:hypothetical protein